MERKTVSNRIIIIVIILFNIFIYFNGMKNGFIWDGNDLIKDNLFIRDISNIKTLLVKEDSQSGSLNTGFFRPFVSLTFLLDYQIFEGEAYGYRITNIVFHTACAIILFFIVFIITDDKLLSFMAAVIFSAQAVHAEAVTILLGRNNVICAFFILVSLYYYIKNNKQGKSSYMVYSMIALFLGATSKEFAFVTPFIFMLYDYSFDTDFAIRRYAKKYVTAIAVLAVFMIYKSFVIKLGASFGFSLDTLYQRIISTFPIMAKYIISQLIPYNVYYYYDLPMNKSFFEISVILSFLFLAALIFLVFKYRKKEKLLFFSLSTYFILLLPVSNIVTLPNLNNAMMADRWLYPASAAFAVFLVNLIALVLKNKKTYLAVTVTALAIFLSVFLMQRNRIYKDNLSAKKNTARVTPKSSIIRNALGLELVRNGKVKEAEEQYKLAIKYNPSYYLPYSNLGMLYIMQKDYQRALDSLSNAYKLRPQSANAAANLGLCNRYLGNFSESNKFYEKAISLNAGLYAYYGLAENYYIQKRYTDSLNVLQKALKQPISELERKDVMQKIKMVQQNIK